MNKRLYILGLITLLVSPLTILAQEDVRNIEEKPSRAWEIGIGASAYKMTRFSILDFYKASDGSYQLNTQKKDVLFGGNISVARELTDYFAIDMQGLFGFTRDDLREGKENRWLAKAQLGLQWRLGAYFNSKYIDPYFRVGAGYMYKNFNIVYNGVEKVDNQDMRWAMDNLYNKQGADRKHFIPISAETGVNMWLNDRFGIGIQGDYIYMPYKNVANNIEGTVRLMWRIGGKSKKPKTEPIYVEVEKRVEVPVQVIKEVIKEVPSKDNQQQIQQICELFNNLYFDFDKASIAPESNETLDRIADFMKNNTSNRYLITGYTDSRGNSEYNIDLSRRRAKAVVDALTKRGVSSSVLRSRGVGKKISLLSPSENNDARRGDRKVSVEIINNLNYWDLIK